MTLPSIDRCECAIHLFYWGAWCSEVEGKQLFCHRFPYPDVSQEELLELTLQLLCDFCAGGENVQGWCPEHVRLAKK